MTKAQRNGLIVFAGLLLVGYFVCFMTPFVWLPQAGIAMALPIIEVPGEVVVPGGWFGGVDLTNTLIGTVAADVLLVIFVLLAWRASNGWTNKVPGRFQAWVETVIETLYNFCKGIGGERLRTAPLLWPIVATIFLFLLTANLMKLFPGFETVGKMHCAHVGKSGYPITEGSTDGTYMLYVDSPLNAGTAQTLDTEHACAAYFSTTGYDAFPAEDAAAIEAQRAAYESRIVALEGAGEASLNDETRHELELAHQYVTHADARIASAQAIPAMEAEVARLDAAIAALEGDHGEAADDHAADDADHDVEDTTGTEESGVQTPPSEETHAEESADEHAETIASTDTVETLKAERDTVVEQLNLAYSQVRYPGASLALSPEELDKGVVPFIFHITPFFRGPATDLSLTIGLAIISMTLVQIYGVMAQGPAYFEKFINVSALGNLKKKPMGAIDFIVGLIEIISEIGKIVSLAFRLFGNLFAGGVALMAISFLVSLLVPGIIYGLEIIIGSVQALVFCVLTLVFSVQAMEAHHGEHAEEGHHGDHHDEGYYDPNALEPGKEIHH